MTSMYKTTEARSVTALRVEETKPTRRQQLIIELIESAKQALPMVLIQAGQIAMTTTDVALISRLGAKSLAAAALAGRIHLVSFTFGVGFLTPIVPVVAEAIGANNLSVARRSLRMGLWAAVLLSLPIMIFALNGERMLLAFSQASNTARLAQQYLFGLAWSVAPALCFHVIRGFAGAVNRPSSIMWITLSALPINALLVYLLIYGKLGLPRLELLGAGVATTLVNCGMVSASLCFSIMRQPLRRYHLLAKFWRFEWSMMGLLSQPLP
ncbi:Na+-driven multidrug efflux pump [Bradyrhizobium japonicum]